jgi:hypothetical protein
MPPPASHTVKQRVRNTRCEIRRNNGQEKLQMYAVMA